MTYNSLQHVFTTMICFVTWPPFLHHHYYKGGQVTKPIMVVKTCYKLLYVIQVYDHLNLVIEGEMYM